MTERPFGDEQGGAPDDEFGAPAPAENADDLAAEPVNTEAVNDDPQDPFEPGEADRIAAEHASAAGGSDADAHPDTVLAAERLGDLQRLQAEYVNYKKRVDRDRAVVQELAVTSVLSALLPVLDDIDAARQHGDLEGGPFASIADKLEASLGKFGLTRFGEVGVEFDPTEHEALMHTAWDASNEALPADATTTTVVTVLQPGYKQGERIIRPARVAVADPE